MVGDAIMEKNYEGPYKERLVEIEERIEDLKAHMNMWSRAGGGRMSMQAISEIDSLEAEKARILDGSQEKIDKIQGHISELQQLKAQCHAINFIKKMKLNNEIKGYEKEKSMIMKR